MTSAKLRKDLKAAIDHIPDERLSTVADYVESIARTELLKQIREGQKAIDAGKGVNWRKVRSHG